MLALSAMLAASGSVPAVAQARLEVRVFARVPAPGYPADAVLGAGGTVYAGTFKSFSSPSNSGASKVFAFSPAGVLKRTYTVAGQAAGAADAVQVATVDRSGTLYLLDQDPARIVKLNPRTGQQTTWATFRSVPACLTTVGTTQCSDGTGGNAPEPDFAAWGPDGSLYVTDYNQALIWRVPPRGGPASVWLTDSRFNGYNIVGPAGIQLMADGHTLLVTTGGGGTDPSTGKLYTLPIEANGKPGQLHQLWESASAEAPDGFAIARSGNVYLALVGPSGNAVVEISPTGQEIARIPANAAANEAMTVPFDAPGSVTFDGEDLIVANEASIDNDSSNWALLEISAAEPGLAPSLPPARSTGPRLKPTYRLRVTPRHPLAGRRTVFHFVATESRLGARHPLVHALIRFGGRARRTNRRGRATVRLVVRRRVRSYRAVMLVSGHRVAVLVIRSHRRRHR